MSNYQAYDDQPRTENDQILDFLSAVANLDFGAASLAYDELMSTQYSDISGSSCSKEFSFLDSQATPQAYSICIPQSESVDQFCFSSGKLSDVPPVGGERGNCLKVGVEVSDVPPVGAECGNFLKVGVEAKEMPCVRELWFELPCSIVKWLGKSTYFLPFGFTVPAVVAVLVISLLIMNTCLKTC